MRIWNLHGFSNDISIHAPHKLFIAYTGYMLLSLEQVEVRMVGGNGDRLILLPFHLWPQGYCLVHGRSAKFTCVTVTLWVISSSDTDTCIEPPHVTAVLLFHHGNPTVCPTLL